MPELVPETGHRPSFEQGGQEPVSPLSPSRATIGLVGGTMAGIPKNTEDLASSSSGSSRGNGDCISYSDTDEMSVNCPQEVQEEGKILL